MNLVETMRIALRALNANKLRAVLTMLGIIIGVGAVIALLAVGKGAQKKLLDQVGGLGSNLVVVLPGNLNQTSANNVAKNAGVLTAEDGKALISSSVPHVVAVAPQFDRFAQIVRGKTNINARVVGTTPDYALVRNMNPTQGQWFGRKELETLANVVMLGPNVADSLFPEAQNGENYAAVIGKTLRINNATYRVIGVMERKGSGIFGSPDDYLYVPLSNAQVKLFASRAIGVYGRNVSALNVQLDDAGDQALSEAIEGSSQVLRQRHKILRQQDDFSIITQAEVLGTLATITATLTFFLGAIAGISLLVGGIGIMNIMLVSVTERTREIGLRKAVGAKRRDILTQFLVEAIVLSVIGGAIGIILGITIGKLVDLTGIIETIVSPDSIILAVGFSIAVGLFFGIYPARRASRLNPIEALRYE